MIANGHYIPNVGTELQPPFDELGREAFAIGEGDHVFYPIQVDDVTVLINVAGVARAEPAGAVGVNNQRFRRLFGIFVIPLEHSGAANENFAFSGDTHGNAGGRLPDAGKFNVIVPMQGDAARYFCGAVNLLQINAQGVEKAHGVWTERRASGVGGANAGKAQPVPNRRKDQPVPDGVSQARA